MPAEFWRVAEPGLAALGVDLTEAQRSAVEAHFRLLIAWNRHINLTALRAPAQMARGHLVDSLTAVAACRRLLRGRREPFAARLLDLGSGGGFPGLPLAIVVGLGRCALVDSVAKKASFLAVAAAAATGALSAAGGTAPEFTVLSERAEQLAVEPEQRAGWDIVTARAVGSLAEVVELALPLLAVGGQLIAWKRDGAERSVGDEIRAAGRIIAATGGGRPIVEPVDASSGLGLPGHRLVIVAKVRPTPDRYPRPPRERQRTALLT